MQIIRECYKCNLSRNVTNIVNARQTGDNPRIMLVGEAPGAEEDRIGLPFQGRSGELLDTILDKANVSVHITNCVRCRPLHNRNPNAEELAACRPYLVKEICDLEPKAVILLGRVPLLNFFPRAAKFTMAEWMKKGAFKYYIDDSDPVLFYLRYHPAYILRNQSMRDMYIDEFVNLLKEINND